MITNLISISASVVVTVVTNVTETPTDFASFKVIPCDERCQVGCLVGHMEGVNPQAKIVTTEVHEVATATFDWNGKRVIESRKLLSSDSKKLVKKTEWAPVSAVTK